VVDGADSRVTRSLVLSPDLAELSRARRFVAEIAAEAGFGEARSFDITLLTSEAAANAIEHAPVKGQVDIKALLYADRLEIQVKGPGEFQTPYRLKEQRTRGLGLPLMAKLSDHLALYSAPEGGTLLSLTFYREGHGRVPIDSPLSPSLKEHKRDEAAVCGADGTCYLDAFFERSLTPLVLLDRDFNFIRVNEAYAKAWRREVDDFPGHNHFEFYPSDAQAIFEAVRRSREPISVEARPVVFPDHPEWGVTYWDWTLTPLLDESGEVEALVLSLQDVTARVRPGAEGGRLTRLLEGRALHRRGALTVTLVALLLEIALFIGIAQFESPSHYLGIPGAAAALIAVVAAITVGPLPGVIVALVGGVAYLALLADFGRSVFWPAIVISIALWTLAAWLAGVAGDYVRRRAAAREAVLSQSIEDQERLMHRLEASEERFRSLAGENERLYEQQLGIAEHLQRALLNIPSAIGPFKVGHLYRSATEAARVGGDFYDVFEVGEGGVAILIGDVTGHGIEAARVATLVKDVVFAFAHLSPRPAEVLGHTNQLLVEKDLPGFVTVFLGIMEKGTCRLTYSSAGHPDVLLKRASGEVERLQSRSHPLGVFAGSEWKAFEAELGVDDRLVLYTDGVIEARRNGDFFGEQRLETLIREAQVSVEHLPDRVLDEVLAFSGGALKDDVAVLVLSLTDGAGGCRPVHGAGASDGARIVA